MNSLSNNSKVTRKTLFRGMLMVMKGIRFGSSGELKLLVGNASTCGIAIPEWNFQMKFQGFHCSRMASEAERIPVIHLVI